MEKHEVTPAFIMLLDEIEDVVRELNEEGAQLLTAGKYDGARALIEKIESINAIRDKVQSLSEDWHKLSVGSVKNSTKDRKSVKQKRTTLLKQGLRTPNDAFHLPILQALVQLGGSARLGIVLNLVEAMMKDQLNKCDYESLPSNPNELRWRNNAQWARLKLVQEGYLASDSPRGIWEITDTGREKALKLNPKENLTLAEKTAAYRTDHSHRNSTKNRILFDIGGVYHRQHDLHDMYGGNPQSGISPCSKHPFIFLFTSSHGVEFGYQDGWLSDTEYVYTGEGQIGDMEMSRGNLAILNHQTDGRDLYLFKKVNDSLYEFIGQFEYQNHEITTGLNGDQRQREIIKFVLKQVKYR